MDYFESEAFLEELKKEIAQTLGVPLDQLPVEVTPENAAKALCTTTRTLAIWRSTGRYNLPYFKAGRMVRYRIADIVKFKASRMYVHTGEVA